MLYSHSSIYKIVLECGKGKVFFIMIGGFVCFVSGGGLYIYISICVFDIYLGWGCCVGVLGDIWLGFYIYL